MTSFTVRHCTGADVPTANALIRESALVLSRGYYTDEQTDAAIAHVFGVDSTLVNDQTYYVVHTDSGELAACGGWSRRGALYGGDQRKMGPASYLEPPGDAARIRAFFVGPSWARQGIGRLLLKTSVDAARTAGFVHLELMATLPGVPFYAALGFVDAGAVVDVLPNRVSVPFVRMTRLIDHQ